MAERELTYGEAVREAIAEEMRRDSRVFLIGEDVAEAGHPFKTLVGLVQEFGTERIIDTPISEPGYAGIGVGAAMTGMRPIVDVMFGDFITLTMDQMVNQAAKAHYMSGGKIKVPIVFRTTLGATRRSAAQHSQSLHAWVSHIPGLKVALPSGPYEAKGLMKTAIRDDSPVVIFEDKMMYRVKGPVPESDYTIPFGVAEIKRAGTDITIVATSSMVTVALGAATMLEEIGISAEVIDPRTTWPLDKQALIDSAKKTSRALVVDEGYERYGVTAEIASVIAEGAFYHLDAPVKRIGAMDVPVPVLACAGGPHRADRRNRYSRRRRRCVEEGLEARLADADQRHHAGAGAGAGERQGPSLAEGPRRSGAEGRPAGGDRDRQDHHRDRGARVGHPARRDRAGRRGDPGRPDDRGHRRGGGRSGGCRWRAGNRGRGASRGKAGAAERWRWLWRRHLGAAGVGSAGAAIKASPLARKLAEQHGVDLAQIKATGGTIQKADVLAYVESQKSAPAGNGVAARLAPASPKARRLAAQRGFDISALAGSGPGGAVLAADVAAAARPAAQVPAAAVAPVPRIEAPASPLPPGQRHKASARSGASWPSA